MMRSMAVLSVFLASEQSRVVGFSMVAPPMVTMRSTTMPSEWKTNTYHPLPIFEPELFDFAQSLLEMDEPPPPPTTTMPALTSPLFHTNQKPPRSPERAASVRMNLSEMTPSELKSRIVRHMAEFVVEEFGQAQISKERNVLLDALQVDTFELEKTVRRVVDIQENLQFVWDVAGDAMVDVGLSDIALPSLKKTDEVNLFDSFKSADDIFADIKFSYST